MTVEQQNQSQLNLIIKDALLDNNIQYLETQVKAMQTDKETIATKIQKMKEELEKDKPDKNAMEVDEIERTVQGLKRKREETQEDKATLSESDKKRVKKAQSIFLNSKKL